VAPENGAARAPGGGAASAPATGSALPAGASGVRAVRATAA
jgi:hypothetical protein